MEVLNLKSFLSLNVLSKLQGLWVSQVNISIQKLRENTLFPSYYK